MSGRLPLVGRPCGAAAAACCVALLQLLDSTQCPAEMQTREDALKKVPMGTREETYAAIRTLLASLGDPFTRFLSPDQYSALRWGGVLRCCAALAPFFGSLTNPFPQPQPILGTQVGVALCYCRRTCCCFYIVGVPENPVARLLGLDTRNPPASHPPTPPLQAQHRRLGDRRGSGSVILPSAGRHQRAGRDLTRPRRPG